MELQMTDEEIVRRICETLRECSHVEPALTLDFMHEAEKRLSDSQCHVYHEALCSLHAATVDEEDIQECPANDYWFHADAQLRALAFIQTIETTKL